jgi:SPP1 gp7 family putative phage head morphogenesis protein
MAELERAATQFVRRVLGLESKRHTDAFISHLKRALGVDLEAVIRQEDLADFLDDAVARNVSLIRSLSQDTFKRIEQAVIAAKIGGQSANSLRKALQKEFGVSAKRAELIAQDQMSKLTSDLNRQRQQQIGISEYVWTTSRDERVRQRHAELEGTTYKWGEPTDAEQGLPPGQPIRCRCVAVGVVKF